MTRDILTIGHSNHTWETFVALLHDHGVEVLVDTRTTPMSRWAPFANARSLPNLLESGGMRYVYMGDALGGKPPDASYYAGNGKPDYRKMRSSDALQTGMTALLKLADESTVALMCAEEDPAKCHRTLLIGPALEQQGRKLLHVRGDGSAQGTGTLSNQKAYRMQLQGALPLEEGDS